MTAAPEIRVRKVFKKLGTIQALAGIETIFQPGLLHGLIGSDGAGKTTLLRTLIGLLHPDQGEIMYWLQGDVIAFPLVRQNIAYMPQQQSLYPDLSIEEHLTFFRELYQIPPDIFLKRSEDLLRMTRLAKFRDRSAGKLSGGMYKKLGLMCALLRNPSVILLDEPTNGVDPISRREFWDLIYALSTKESLIIVATAYMDEAERCDRVHLLESGRMLAAGEPKTLMTSAGVKSFDEIFIKSSEATVVK